MSKDTNREAIIKVLDEEDAWTHIAMRYITSMRTVNMGMLWRKDGCPDQRDNKGRLMVKLNAAIGLAMLVTKLKEEELPE